MISDFDRIIWYSVIHTCAGTDDSINESEIITRCISISIIHTGADDSINKYEIKTSVRNLLTLWTRNSSQWKSDSSIHCLISHDNPDDFDNQNDPKELDNHETFYFLDNPDYKMTLMDMMILIIISHSHWSRWFYQWIWNHHSVWININH